MAISRQRQGWAEAEALALDAVLAAAHRRQQQVGDAVVEQVELIHVHHATVGLGQQPRLEHRLAAGQGGGHIHRAQQPVFGDAQRHLHEGGGDHAGGQQGLGVAATGVGAQLLQPLAHGLVPVVGALGIHVEGLHRRAAQIEHVDGRQQGVQAPGQHRLAGAAAAGDHHAAKAGVHGRQQQGQLEGAVAGDRRQRKGAGRGLASLGRGRC